MKFQNLEVKAKWYLNHDLVKLNSSIRGYLHFIVNSYDVFRTRKGEWSCNAARKKKDGEKFGCIFMPGIDCSHVKACKMYLEQIKKEVV